MSSNMPQEVPKRLESLLTVTPALVFHGLDKSINGALRVIDILTIETCTLITISRSNLYKNGDYAFIVPLQKCTEDLGLAIDRSFHLSHYGLRLLDLMSDHRHASISEGKTVKEQEDNDDDEVEITSHIDGLVHKMNAILTLLESIQTNVIDALAKMDAATNLAAHGSPNPVDGNMSINSNSASQAGSHPPSNKCESFYNTLEVVISNTLGGGADAESRATGLINCLTSLAMFKTDIDKIHSGWKIELQGYETLRDEQRARDGNDAHRLPDSFQDVYAITGCYIEQVQHALHDYPQHFYRTEYVLFSGQGVDEHVRTRPGEWDLHYQHAMFPTPLISRSLPSFPHDRIESHLDPNIVGIFRTGFGMYDLYLEATAWRSFWSRLGGRTFRCIDLEVTWRFAYPPGSVANPNTPDIIRCFPEYTKSSESAIEATKGVTTGTELSRSISNLASSDETETPGWSSIQGASFSKNSAEGYSEARWRMSENNVTATGSDACIVGVSLQLAQPAQEIISEVCIKTTYVRSSGLRRFLPFVSKVPAQVTGRQRINLLSLRTMAIMSRRVKLF